MLTGASVSGGYFMPRKLWARVIWERTRHPQIAVMMRAACGPRIMFSERMIVSRFELMDRYSTNASADCLKKGDLPISLPLKSK